MKQETDFGQEYFKLFDELLKTERNYENPPWELRPEKRSWKKLRMN